MATPAEIILQDLFETSRFENVSTGQLKQITDEHPYYGAAHFLLAKKLRLSEQEGYLKASQKSALHFSDDLWLHYNLNDVYDDEANIITDAALPQEAEINTLVDNPLLPDDAEAEEIEETDLTGNNILNEKLSSILQEQVAEFEKPVETSAEIPVENTHYHRIDYFDSQGIKLEEEKNNDKLGSQLKRFTDWLKQMKSINPNPVSLGSDEAGESQVQNIAAHSNEAEEIVTEAMAEVLLKQGKPEHAIEIYEKLSFNNPSKSAYFAAKIAEIKG